MCVLLSFLRNLSFCASLYNMGTAVQFSVPFQMLRLNSEKRRHNREIKRQDEREKGTFLVHLKAVFLGGLSGLYCSKLAAAVGSA